MSNAKRFQGEHVNHDRPDWRPILALLGPDLTGWFMWMGELELSDGARVHAYKHRDTRRYLHLAEDGRAFSYDWDGKAIDENEPDYVEMPRTRAIDAAFRGARRTLSPDAGREVRELVDAAWDVAAADGTFEIDPQELELQAEFEERRDEAA